LKQRVARGSGGGMGLSFHWVAFDIEGMLGRKWSAEVLVGLQAMGSVHLALALPTQRQRALQKGYPDLIQKLIMLSIPI